MEEFLTGSSLPRSFICEGMDKVGFGYRENDSVLFKDMVSKEVWLVRTRDVSVLYCRGNRLSQRVTNSMIVLYYYQST